VVKRDWPGQRNARRATVDHAADRRPVAFAEGGHAKQMAEGIERHGSSGCGRVVARASCVVKAEVLDEWLFRCLNSG
jgi:hypothetical protein